MWRRCWTSTELENYIGGQTTYWSQYDDDLGIFSSQGDNADSDDWCFQLSRSVPDRLQWRAHLLGNQWAFCRTLLSGALLWQVGAACNSFNVLTNINSASSGRVVDHHIILFMHRCKNVGWFTFILQSALRLTCATIFHLRKDMMKKASQREEDNIYVFPNTCVGRTKQWYSLKF